MDYNNNKIMKGLLAFIVTITVLSASYLFYEKHYLNKRINQELLTIEGVLSAEVSGTSSDLTVSVVLDRVDNLPAAYQSVYSLIAGYTHDKEFALIILDKKNELTQQFAEKVQLAIFEGVNKHNYTWLDQLIKEEALKNNLHTRLWIDERNMYLQIDNDTGYQYIIVPVNSSDHNKESSN